MADIYIYIYMSKSVIFQEVYQLKMLFLWYLLIWLLCSVFVKCGGGVTQQKLNEYYKKTCAHLSKFAPNMCSYDQVKQHCSSLCQDGTEQG